MNNKRLVVVTGLSGSGRSAALKAFEDMGFHCVDNLPLGLFPAFVVNAEHSEESTYWAIGIDVRDRQFAAEFPGLYDRIKGDCRSVHMELLFLEASDQALVRRYSESRRPHPLSRGGTPLDGIAKERLALAGVRNLADRTMDTSSSTVHDLRGAVEQHYTDRDAHRPMSVTLATFGYKYGAPYDLDLLFDLRFLPNPYFVPELRNRTGEDRPVHEYVTAPEDSRAFIAKLLDFLEYLLPRYKKEGKSYLTIGFGCTGGKHRSVAIALVVLERLIGKGYEVAVRHRDMQK